MESVPRCGSPGTGNDPVRSLFYRGALYNSCCNPIYIGEIRHKGRGHPGLHEPIIDRELWDSTRLLLQSRGATCAASDEIRRESPHGKLFDESGKSLTPSHAVKGERRYRYYVSRNLTTGTRDSARTGWRLPGPEIERTVASAAYTILSDETAIAESAQTIGLSESKLPSIFSMAAAWMKRLQSDVEVGPLYRP